MIETIIRKILSEDTERGRKLRTLIDAGEMRADELKHRTGNSRNFIGARVSGTDEEDYCQMA